jgi:hypothetical protein
VVVAVFDEPTVEADLCSNVRKPWSERTNSRYFAGQVVDAGLADEGVEAAYHPSNGQPARRNMCCAVQIIEDGG